MPVRRFLLRPIRPTRTTVTTSNSTFVPQTRLRCPEPYKSRSKAEARADCEIRFSRKSVRVFSLNYRATLLSSGNTKFTNLCIWFAFLMHIQTYNRNFFQAEMAHSQSPDSPFSFHKRVLHLGENRIFYGNLETRFAD